MKKTILWSLVLGVFVAAPSSVFASDGDAPAELSSDCKNGIKAYVSREKAKEGFDVAKCEKKKKGKVTGCKGAPLDPYKAELKKQCNGDTEAAASGDRSAESEEKPKTEKPKQRKKIKDVAADDPSVDVGEGKKTTKPSESEN